MFKIFNRTDYQCYNIQENKGDISYTTNDKNIVLNDIEYEGSGELKLYTVNEDIHNKFIELLNTSKRYYYSHNGYINLLLDENDVELVDDTICLLNCNCVNCHAHSSEQSEINCDVHCKCINCQSV